MSKKKILNFCVTMPARLLCEFEAVTERHGLKTGQFVDWAVMTALENNQELNVRVCDERNVAQRNLPVDIGIGGKLLDYIDAHYPDVSTSKALTRIIAQAVNNIKELEKNGESLVGLV